MRGHRRSQPRVEVAGVCPRQLGHAFATHVVLERLHHRLRMDGNHFGGDCGLQGADMGPRRPQGGLAQPGADWDGRLSLLQHHRGLRPLEVVEVPVQDVVRLVAMEAGDEERVVVFDEGQGHGILAQEVHRPHVDLPPDLKERVRQDVGSAGLVHQLCPHRRRQQREAREALLRQPALLLGEAPGDLGRHAHAQGRGHGVLPQELVQVREGLRAVLPPHQELHDPGGEERHDAGAEDEAGEQEEDREEVLERAAGPRGRRPVHQRGDRPVQGHRVLIRPGMVQQDRPPVERGGVQPPGSGVGGREAADHEPDAADDVAAQEHEAQDLEHLPQHLALGAEQPVEDLHQLHDAEDLEDAARLDHAQDRGAVGDNIQVIH
mmetsp:Transcript_59320/g.168684  ORF Transcript_59320/g.168684 Transcript_59320/m.168684 type:complete len:377 (-) Transcript_59320:916-2046(-)